MRGANIIAEGDAKDPAKEVRLAANENVTINLILMVVTFSYSLWRPLCMITHKNELDRIAFLPYELVTTQLFHEMNNLVTGITLIKVMVKIGSTMTKWRPLYQMFQKLAIR